MSDGLEHYLKAMEERLKSTEIRVGFMNGAVYPESGEAVASVAARNEYGDPANNQPPRPFFRNAIAGHKEEWAATLARGLERGMDAQAVFEVVGAQMKGDIQTSISELMEPKLSPVTLQKRRTRKESPNNSTKPLVDTSRMFDNVSFEIVEKQAEKQSLWQRFTNWLKG